MTSSAQRQQWIESAAQMFRKHFEWCGYTIPNNVRLSIGIPKGRHGGKKAVGQCWSNRMSSDDHFEIFASPEYGHKGTPDANVTSYMLETIAHELIPCDCRY